MPLGNSSKEEVALSLQFELTDIVREEIGMNEMFATLMAEAITRGLRKRLGGQEIYVPAPDKRSRNEIIWREFNGQNLEEIMRKTGLGKSQIYEINKKKPAGFS